MEEKKVKLDGSNYSRNTPRKLELVGGSFRFIPKN